MRVSISLTNYSWPGPRGLGPELARVAGQADEAGVDTVWVPDGGRTLRHKLQVLARHCDEAGRPYEAVEKTLSTRLHPGEPGEEFVARCRAVAALGIEHVVVLTPGPWSAGALATLGAAIPVLEEVGA